MRKHATGAIGALEQRCRYPIGGIGDFGAETRADAHCEPQAVSGSRSGGCGNKTGGNGKEALAKRFVVGKSSACQHDTFTRGNLSLAGRIQQYHTANDILFDQQVFHGRAEQDLHFSRKQRSIETCCQRVAETQGRSPRRAKPLQRVLRDQPQRSQGRSQRTARFPKMGNVEPVDHHAAEQGELRQRRPQSSELRT
jgi:hypothetical protein